MPQTGRNKPTGMDSVLPVTIKDDIMTSTEFIVQYTDENVLLNDTFRLSVRISNCLNDVPQKLKEPADYRPRLLIELLFSNCEDIGGFQKMMESTEYDEIHTHFPLIGRQEVLLSDSPGVDFFEQRNFNPAGFTQVQTTIEEFLKDFEIEDGFKGVTEALANSNAFEKEVVRLVSAICVVWDDLLHRMPINIGCGKLKAKWRLHLVETTNFSSQMILRM